MQPMKSLLNFKLRGIYVTTYFAILILPHTVGMVWLRYKITIRI